MTVRDMREERNLSPRPPLPGRGEEFVDITGSLRVPVARAMDPAPKRAGWKPRWVNINLDDPIQKVVLYSRVDHT